jgi:hypothetical protein
MPPINDPLQLEVYDDLTGGIGDDDITEGEPLPDDDHDADFTIGCLFGNRCLCADSMHYTVDCYTVEIAEEFNRVMRQGVNVCLTATPGLYEGPFRKSECGTLSEQQSNESWV